ncbi:hypothetical protein [Mangrovimonas sp. TPBH4]|uniref:hypothetical protein n=1 Tax=Mangrovimonas sp. TPBH4 TaxID=1645914 RepID=UPI0006B53F8E|nr:hypothetical protein [Mangrovimonas sp. TPBH4]
MNSRWYISTLIIILSLLGGIATKQHNPVPNQEIVLQFSNGDVSSVEAKTTIVKLTQQLQIAGVEHLKVSELQDGQLKITYYSEADVASIKKILTEDNLLELGYAGVEHKSQSPKIPVKDSSVKYDLDVYEIHKGDPSAFDLGGKMAVELKADHDRSFMAHESLSVDVFSIDTVSTDIKVAYKFYKNIALAIDNISKKIPEVRAGPSLKGMLG